ncbi:uncharacterized protein LOC125226356 [Leguminivora glycinivorella]|uniref:uncharacterized protein LOC125226356 n=1 Tax=Leguminivora glycinivorella TaxID=1035111 RepID=UPI00200E2ED0|nr:uncharacterized protein LOC125226356 [Leguminivora glycinivorella]
MDTKSSICSHEWHIPRPSLSGSSDSRSRGGSASSQGSSSNHSTHSVSSGSLLLSAAHLARIHGRTTESHPPRLGNSRISNYETAVVTIPEETKDPDLQSNYWKDVKRAPEADTASIASSTHFTVVNGFTKHRTTKEPKSCCCSHSHQITVLVISMTILFSACILAAICYVEMRMRKETGMYKYS